MLQNTSPLSFTDQERTALQTFGALLAKNPGKAFTIPPDCMTAINRVMAPVDAALHKELLAKRHAERCAPLPQIILR